MKSESGVGKLTEYINIERIQTSRRAGLREKEKRAVRDLRMHEDNENGGKVPKAEI
jgi:hypothetical protein